MRDPEYANAAWHARDTKPVRAGSATWWMALRGGFARVEHVGVVIGDGEVDRDTATVIFGVAAMAVMSFAGHGAHWAFWAENNVEYTKEVAYKLFELAIGCSNGGCDSWNVLDQEEEAVRILEEWEKTMKTMWSQAEMLLEPRYKVCAFSIQASKPSDERK